MRRERRRLIRRVRCRICSRTATAACAGRHSRAWEAEWGRQADLCAEALNRIAGFRLKLYGRRGWNSVLKEPLDMNRMRRETLEAMWAAVDESRPALVRYLNRKAELLGLERLDWHDVEAPIGVIRADRAV